MNCLSWFFRPFRYQSPSTGTPKSTKTKLMTGEAMDALCEAVKKYRDSLDEIVWGMVDEGGLVEVEHVNQAKQQLKLKEACNIELPHAYFCFAHGGSLACEQLNAAYGYTCPRCACEIPPKPEPPEIEIIREDQTKINRG